MRHPMLRALCIAGVAAAVALSRPAAAADVPVCSGLTDFILVVILRSIRELSVGDVVWWANLVAIPVALLLFARVVLSLSVSAFAAGAVSIAVATTTLLEPALAAPPAAAPAFGGRVRRRPGPAPPGHPLSPATAGVRRGSSSSVRAHQTPGPATFPPASSRFVSQRHGRGRWPAVPDRSSRPVRRAQVSRVAHLRCVSGTLYSEPSCLASPLSSSCCQR
jgi:hypothetical protein